MFKFLKRKLIDWCLSEQTITIGELHKLSSPYDVDIYNEQTNNLKFVEQTTPDNILVKTPTGYSAIKHTHKTVEYQIYIIKTTNHELHCADEHIVIGDNDEEIFVKDLQVGDLIQTESGAQPIESINITDQYEQMYDLELDDDNHVYYSNGILSHNSISSAAYLLWYAIFQFDKTVLIASNKNSNAMEMVLRIRYAYENLPDWLKPGIKLDNWNKHELGFDNGSRILSTATSEDSGRGLSISLLFLDEFAFVAASVQTEFWTSIAPVLATGGSCIIASTPNGDINIYAELWRGAQVQSNGFASIHVAWDEPPDRDEAFKKDEIGRIGERRWRQEYECEFLSSDALLISSLFLVNATAELLKIKPLRVVKEVTFWDTICPDKTYIIGVDPSTGNGNDYSVITIFDFPALVQVGEYRSNTMSTTDLYEVLKNILIYIYEITTNVYFSVECNGVGEGVISLYEADEDPPNADFVSEIGPGKRGMVTTSKTKMKACVNFKEMLERGKLTIKSIILLKELKSYARCRGSYAALTGATDDIISSVLIVIRILEEIATYDQAAFEKLYIQEFDQWDEEDYDGYGDYDEEDEGLPVII